MERLRIFTFFPGPFALVLAVQSVVCLILIGAWLVPLAFAISSITIAVRLLTLVFFYRGRLGDCIHYSAVLVYFSIAPGLQWIAQASFWGSPPPSYESIAVAWGMVSLYCIGFELSGLLGVVRLREQNRFEQISPSRLLRATLVLASVAMLVLVANADYALSPRGQAYLLDSRSAAYSIFFAILPKSTLLASFLVSIFLFRRHKTTATFILMLYLLVACIYFANPVHTARQQLFIGIFPLAVLLISGDRARKIVSILSITIGLTSVGPLLNSIARDRFHGTIAGTFPLSADFDAMYNAAGVSDIFAKSDYGLGRYMLNALSFPLPGSLKLFPAYDPLLADRVYYLYSQSNISLPPFATFYLDFGYLGCLALGMVVGYAIRWASIACAGRPDDKHFGSSLIGALILASYIPLIRGPIQGMGPFVATMLFAAFMLTKARKVRSTGRELVQAFSGDSSQSRTG